METQPTLFEKILNKEISADVVFENEYVLAFTDIQPQAPVHVLVIPKKKLAFISECPEHDATYMGHFLQGVALTARALKLEKDGYRVVINNGASAAQTVFYLHAHILAGRQLHWPPG